jgi:hypothetical protein
VAFGFVFRPAGASWKSSRGLRATAGVNVHCTRSVPDRTLAAATMTSRVACVYTRTFSEPLLVVTVPDTSAFHSDSRRSTPVTSPLVLSSSSPMGSRALPKLVPPVPWWSRTRLSPSRRDSRLAVPVWKNDAARPPLPTNALW